MGRMSMMVYLWEYVVTIVVESAYGPIERKGVLAYDMID
jgi:hypothetical protein